MISRRADTDSSILQPCDDHLGHRTDTSQIPSQDVKVTSPTRNIAEAIPCWVETGMLQHDVGGTLRLRFSISQIYARKMIGNDFSMKRELKAH